MRSVDKRPPFKALPASEVKRLLPSLGLDAVALAAWVRTLPPELLDKLWAASIPRVYGSGEVLFHKGEVSEGLYFIDSGEVRSSTVTEDGQEFILYLFERGSCVGLVSSLDGEPSPSTCRAHGDTRVRLLPRQELLAILEREPRYYRYFVDLLLRWVRGLLSLIEDQAVLSVRARLAKRLLQFAYLFGRGDAQGVLIPFKLPQDELGLLLGATRQSIHQQLKDFRSREWIAIEHGMITLRDTAALARCIAERGGGAEHGPH